MTSLTWLCILCTFVSCFSHTQIHWQIISVHPSLYKCWQWKLTKMHTPHGHIHTLTQTHSIKDLGLCLKLRAQQGIFLFQSGDQIGQSDVWHDVSPVCHFWGDKVTMFLHYLSQDAELENGDQEESAQQRANADLMLMLTAEIVWEWEQGWPNWK